MANTNIKVLLIEDDPGDVAVIRKHLDKMKGVNLEIHCEGRLQDGLATLKTSKFDILLLDLSLPDGRGINAVTKVHAEAPGIPVVVLNVIDNWQLALESVKEGAQDYFVKDKLNEDQLRRAILFAMERKRVERELARLASFAWQNANAIIETDVTGKVITYMNPAAKKQFPELSASQSEHPFLKDLAAASQELEQRQKETLIREIIMNDQIYEQHLSCVPESKLIRSYVVDVTERRQQEQALLSRTREVERMNKVMLGRELKMIELKKRIKELEGNYGERKSA